MVDASAGAAPRKAVFLDRDGVLNRAVVRNGKPHPPQTLAEFEILPGVAAAVETLRGLGYLTVVVTNQPDVARGSQSREIVEAMNAVLRETLKIDDVRVCYHTDTDDCDCRKPRPGMILAAAKDWNIDLGRSFLVGDRWRDMEAGHAAGCRTILIDYGYDEPRGEAWRVVDSLLAAMPLFHAASARVGMKTVEKLRVKIFADGADLEGIRAMAAKPFVKGFTTNPTLMRKVGISDYETFARSVLAEVPTRPVSFEVFADDFETMEAQARVIASWGPNVFVKIPVTNTKGQSAAALVARLSKAGIQVNVTALMTVDQVQEITQALSPDTAANISVFAGRVADTGRDPLPVMVESLAIMKAKPKAELIWASPRELLNIFQADDIGCHIITVTNDVLGKLSLVGKDLNDYSLETVAMFYRDARAAGFSIRTEPVAA